MAEVDNNTTALITISYQAYNRFLNEDYETFLCDCVVTVLFASIFIEANINHIIKKMNATSKLEKFFKNKKNIGLHEKIAWFYNQYLARIKARDKDDALFKYKIIHRKICRKFPGLHTLIDFRNDLAHGDIQMSIINLRDVIRLRRQAKEIVEELFNIAKYNGYSIPRVVKYEEVIEPIINEMGSKTYVSKPIYLSAESSS